MKMLELWTQLTTPMQVLWGVTLAASLIFLIQSVLTFIGADADTDFDMDGGDADGNGMGLLTFRNFVNFALGFGWTAILLHDSISSVPVLIVLSIIVGVLLVALVMMLFKWLAGMQQSGNIDVRESAVGCTGTVYLPVPAAREGEGKVQISIKGSLREYAAQTAGSELATGTPVKVVEVINENTLLVEKK